MNSRILVVEDEENIQHALKLNLEIEGYNVVVCGNGNEATRLFREQRFDLVVLAIRN
jgi:two-component system alkaline phosphatase synthesis response regulator PhoP